MAKKGILTPGGMVRNAPIRSVNIGARMDLFPKQDEEDNPFNWPVNNRTQSERQRRLEFARHASRVLARGSGAGQVAASDPTFSNVVFLTSFDADDGINRAVDESGNYLRAGDITFAGTAQLDTAKQKFGTASLLLDGDSDYVTLPDSGDWQFQASEPFTIEAWIYSDTTGAVQVIVAQDRSGNNNRSFDLRKHSTNKLLFLYSTDGSANTNFSSDAALPTGEWVHVAVTRDASGTIRMFVNGTVQTATASETGALYDANTPLSIGRFIDSASTGFFNGWIDEVRILKGKCLWTDTFTPPTSAYDRDVTDSNWPYTVLLCGFDGTDGATAFVNEAPASLAFNNTAQIDTAEKKFGAASLLLDGDSDYVTFMDDDNWTFGNGVSFSIEAWVYTDGDTADEQAIITQYDTAGDNRSWEFRLQATTLNLAFVYSTDGTAGNTATLESDDAVPSGEWVHVAVQRTAGVLALYINGVRQTTTASFSAAVANSTEPLRVGTSVINSAAERFFDGWIDEIRIVVGEAIFPDTDFTPPTAEFPRS